ncbi:hypothetical protein FAP39_16030 [Shimia litoralis]|uniref:Flagellar basal body rod protein N-terminal domain-containing protein n=1 Tax=Shimia litoralis TaxID=420403 RepID=A0A4U7MTB7_9RHOB|nr:hypothetical protein FAP39_16030 [Shimia litoralis]
MTDFTSALDLSTSGLRAQAVRLRHVSENIANADTLGYRRKAVSFETAFGLDDGQVSVGRVTLDQKEFKEIFNPSHPLADETGHFKGEVVAEIRTNC